MKVILLEDVLGAGGAGEVVEVKDGYARNKLLPAGIAIEANKTNMKTLEHRRAKIAAKKAADKDMAQELAVRIEGKQVDFTAKAGESGKLFGSITAHDIAGAVHEKLGFEIDRRKLLLDTPLKEVGMHDVKYRIYPEVEATIKVNILPDGVAVPEYVEVKRDTYSDRALDDEDGNYYSERAEEPVAEASPVIASGENAPEQDAVSNSEAIQSRESTSDGETETDDYDDEADDDADYDDEADDGDYEDDVDDEES